MPSKASRLGKSSFGQTLHFITDVKLAELEKQRLAYEAHSKVLDEPKSTRLSNDNNDKAKILNRVHVLAKAVSSWRGSGAVTSSSIISSKLTLSDLNFWLEQAEHDPCFNLDVARGWAVTLEEHMRHSLMRFDSAKLFGSLFNEWIASGDSSTLAYQKGADDSVAADADDALSFEHVELEKSEIREQREKLEAIVFEDHKIDVEKLNAYMESLFASNKDTTAALATLRGHMSSFGRRFERKEIIVSDVQYAIQGLLASGLMDEDKREALKAFQENATIMTEIVSVLNMRMNSLGSWTWPKEGTLVEFRRHLNGKYRPFTDPEIVDALLLHHIGVSWQVELKARLGQLFDSKAWVRPTQPTIAENQRLYEQLRESDDPESIDTERRETCRNFFFLSQLHEEPSQPSNYDDLVDAPETTENNRPSPAVIKRKLLHIMTTECYLNQTVHGSHSIVRSDMEMFGPSLPHGTVLTVLEFMGIPKQWINFFQAFLSAPLLFSADSVPRIRKRGTPISYALSILFGEAVLFVMDFAVNQSAGLHLYRMHDDLWLWDSDPKKVTGAWAEMNRYAGLAGLKFNVKKTGSSFVGPRTENHALLPKGDIRWGFLKFDPDASRFVIDQKEVDMHILDMHRQLSGTKSVFGWINAYNKYMAFFLRNFGGIPANCFNSAHFMELINTMGRIQLERFPNGEKGSVGAIRHLKRTLEERFGITDLPDGYFYFPIEHGGLGLRNRVLELLSLERRGMPMSSSKGAEADEAREEVDDETSNSEGGGDEGYGTKHSTAGETFAEQVELDRHDYDSLKKRWNDEIELRRRRKRDDRDLVEFMSFEEYISLRESRLYRWLEGYRYMLECPEPRDITLVPKVREALDESRWGETDWYDKWIVGMYGGEVMEKFGKLEVVDRSLIPIGMVELFQTSRMKLDH